MHEENDGEDMESDLYGSSGSDFDSSSDSQDGNEGQRQEGIQIIEYGASEQGEEDMSEYSGGDSSDEEAGEEDWEMSIAEEEVLS
jgi:hypothetical protein